MYVLTVKADGGTQDVLGFYEIDGLYKAVGDAEHFLKKHKKSRRAIVRLEYYNPAGEIPDKRTP